MGAFSAVQHIILDHLNGSAGSIIAKAGTGILNYVWVHAELLLLEQAQLLQATAGAELCLKMDESL